MAKIYGVYKEGKIYSFSNWAACKNLVMNKTASTMIVYRSFKTKDDRAAWIKNQLRWRKRYDSKPGSVYTAFVDGSVKDIGGEPTPSYGVAIFDDNDELVHEECGIVTNKRVATTRNEAGELEAALHAAAWAHTNGKKILIVYDYEGICSYASETWEAKTELAKHYMKKMQVKFNNVVYGMQWIKGHGKGTDFLTKGNAAADELAGGAFDEVSER